MGKQRAKPAGQKQLRVIAKHEESTADHVADATEQTQGSNNSWPYQHVDYSSPAAGNGALILQNYSLVVPCWSLSDAFCLHEPCLQAAAGSSSEQDRQLSCLPLLAQNGSRLDALLQDAYQPGSSLAGIVQLWREGRYRERTQLALQLAHHTPDTLLAEAAWAVMDLVPSTASGWCVQQQTVLRDSKYSKRLNAYYIHALCLIQGWERRGHMRSLQEKRCIPASSMSRFPQAMQLANSPMMACVAVLFFAGLSASRWQLLQHSGPRSSWLSRGSCCRLKACVTHKGP